ncbi:heterogeneous nuclear ribonucleoprotein A0 [Trifolium repens]|nr:heterogeneous nuclear ribonucleoprotein A0 [Trifolium repens]
MDDVYVARKHNKNGEPYGFVKFSNVRDVTKMTKDLNAVWFGEFRVRASVARFDRNATGVGRRPEAMQASLSRGAVVTKDGPQAPTRQAIRMVGDPSNKATASTPVSGREGVLVGDIVLNLGNRNKPIAQAESQQQPPKSLDVPAVIVKESESNIFMRNYRSKSDDVQWAKNGLVATVINGEAIPVVQNRITDAGLKDLVVTPMGADKVFICRPEGGGDIMVAVGGAEKFFRLVFSSWARWDKDWRPYQRGAWVRLYGVPLSACDDLFASVQNRHK